MITGVVLARNEEANIVDCLKALRPHVAEILLIDMESSDRTVELARPYIARVLRHPLMRNFDSARNIAIPVAEYEWLWFVDADERIPLATGKFVNDVIRTRGHEFEALSIPFKSYCCGKWMQHCGWWPGYTGPRVLKRGHFQYAKRIHGGVRLDGREWMVKPDPLLGVDHFGIRDVQQYVEKINRYSSAEAENLAQDGHRWNWRAAIVDMMRDLWTTYERHPGRLDGERGWLAAWMSGQYRWLAQTKLIDLQSDADAPPNPDAAPADLDDAMRCMQDALAQLRALRPQIPLGIVWRALVCNESGYAEEGRTFLKGLALQTRPLTLDDQFPWSEQDAGIALEDKALLRALYRVRRPRNAIAVAHCLPGVAVPDRRAAVNVIRTMIETDRLPPHWVSQVDAYDEVWVPSQHVADSCRRSWIAPEKIRIIPACLDTSMFQPQGERFPLPEALKDRFVFLSVFDWTPRKGGRLLLENYCREFGSDEGVGLLLKLTRIHGHARDAVYEDCDRVLREIGQSLEARPDIVLIDQTLSTAEMASLYRSVDAFVLASHGEGWGRPYMEAMACGLPAIGTAATGNLEFMNEDNSLLIPAELVEVPEEQSREFPLFQGHRWYQPDEQELRRLMRLIISDRELGNRVGERAAQEIASNYNLQAGAEKIESAVQAAEDRLVSRSVPPAQSDQIRVVLEGELFSGHSFSNINEQLCRGLAREPSLALSVNRTQSDAYTERPDFAHEIQPFIGREYADGPQVTIRHAYPPDWTPPRQGFWVHIQPWEFGHLPLDWIAALSSQVDEIWAPSEYVRRVYERSGISPEKIQVIPWGIDTRIFTPDALPLLLDTGKKFHFLYVGGTIARKGFDRLLDAYLAEFTPEDDVCLVVKDVGSGTVYQNMNFRQQIIDAMRDPEKPAILYLDRPLSPGQLASLYTACDCLVAPYRGEGFGLPILEAMACGLSPIVPIGGATDDYVSEATAFLLPSEEVEVEAQAGLSGPLLEHSVRQEDLRAALRRVVDHEQETRLKGKLAAKEVRDRYTWNETTSRMTQRLKALVDRGVPLRKISLPLDRLSDATRENTVCTIVFAQADARELADTLAHVMPFVTRTICVTEQPSDDFAAVAAEYGAEVASSTTISDEITEGWLLRLDSGEHISEAGFRRLPAVLASLPGEVRGVEVQVAVRDDDGEVLSHKKELRLLRRDKSEQKTCFDSASFTVQSELCQPIDLIIDAARGYASQE